MRVKLKRETKIIEGKKKKKIGFVLKFKRKKKKKSKKSKKVVRAPNTLRLLFWFPFRRREGNCGLWIMERYDGDHRIHE